jgi:hypothetical protein
MGSMFPCIQYRKFIKKLDSIPEIVLQEDQPMKIALALAERGLVGQFMGLWPQQKPQMIGSKETGDLSFRAV